MDLFNFIKGCYNICSVLENVSCAQEENVFSAAFCVEYFIDVWSKWFI